MKRIKCACLDQTIHFELKEDVGHDEAVALMRQELAGYKESLDRKNTRYRIEEEAIQPDGSVLLKIRRQYNSYDCGGYLQ